MTFVFTDIEGSTPLLKRLGDDFAALIEHHDELLRAAFTAHDGRIVSTAGDSMFVAFSDPAAAVAACCAAQRSIASGRWPREERPRVRMGVHLGVARPHRGDYAAMAVNQAARVMSAAHGGQILLTDVVADRLDGPLGSAVAPIGRYRLRDFDEPPTLYQHVEWAVAGDSPVRATPTKGHNLVLPGTAFFGREAEMAALREHLTPGAIVSVVGPGGVGKSRLALEVGTAVADAWPDGVWAADLTDVEDSALVVERLADVVGVTARESTARIDDVVERLRSRRAIVIYDGLDHHVDTCADLVATIRRECPGVAQLATGREPLRVQGEHRIVAAPLAVPAVPSAGSQQVFDADSTQLFLDRARTVRTDLPVDDAALRAIAEICQHVDGVPLAIEIAAARVDVLTVDEILDALDDQFRILRTRDRSIPERQRTMLGLLEWSTRLLDGAERVALRRLATFTGPFRLDAAEVAVGDDGIPADDVQEILWSLVDRSLVVADTARRPTEYRLFEAVQQYGRRLLRQEGETELVGLRVANWYAATVGPDRTIDRAWIEAMNVVQSNLRGVIRVAAGADPELAQRLACSLGRYHEAVQSFRPGIEALTRLARDLPAPTTARVALLAVLADLRLRTGDIAAADDLVAEATALQRVVGPPPWNDAALDRTRGDIALRSGDDAGAEAIARAALRRDLSERGRARMWNLLGIAAVSQGDNDTGYDALRRELEIYIAEGTESKQASAYGNVAETALRAGALSLAAEHQARCLELALTLGQPVMLAYSSLLAARLARSRADWATAVALQTNAEAALAEIGHRLYEADERAAEELLSEARARLDHTRYEQARSAGREMDVVAAAELAERLFHLVRESPDHESELP